MKHDIYLKKRITFYFVFIKSIIASSIVIGVVFALFSLPTAYPALPSSTTQWVNLFLSFIPYGVVLNLLYEELVHKELYYFYYNQGIGKIELWIVSILFPVSIYLIFNLIISLCQYFLK